MVGIAPDVSGLLQEVLVRDNQVVRRGEVLFRIDRDRFALALQQAEAVLTSRHVSLLQAQRDPHALHPAGPERGLQSQASRNRR